jgi:hypothetical protein
MLQRLAALLAAKLPAHNSAGGAVAASAAAKHAAAACCCGGSMRELATAAAAGRWPPPYHSSYHQQQQQQAGPRVPPQSWPSQLQQARGFAAAKAKGKQAAKGGKKGAAAPKKKAKQRLETKPFNDKDPLLQRVVSLLVPQARAPAAAVEAPEAAADACARAKAYSGAKMRAHRAWRAGLHEKLQLKRAALAALPPALRGSAAEEDLEPFPLTRHALYETAPSGYRD